MENNYSKSIRLQCITCGAEDFFETDKRTSVITCTKCNRIYNGGYDELVELNQKRIDDEIELTKEEIQKYLNNEILNTFKKHGFKKSKMIGTIISALSVIIAFVALLKSFFSDRKTKQLDFRLKQIELARKEKESEDAKKASIEVNVIETPNRQANKLRFYNKGKAVARNINFSIPSDDESNNIQLRIASDYLPYPQLLSQQAFDISYIDFSYLPHQTIVITWEDDFSNVREVTMVVDM